MSTKKDLAAQVQEYTAKLHSEAADLKQERAQQEARKQYLLDAPIGEDDFYQMMGEYIDAQAQSFVKNSGVLRHKERFAYPMVNQHILNRVPISFAFAEGIRRGEDSALLDSSDAGSLVFGGYGPAGFHAAMCFFFGDTIKQKLIALFKTTGPHLDSKDAESIGPTVADRRVEIAAIEVRIAEIDSALSEISDTLKTFIPPLTPQEVAEQQRQKAEAIKKRNTTIREEFDGRNLGDMVKRYRLSRQELQAIIDSDPLRRHLRRA